MRPAALFLVLSFAPLRADDAEFFEQKIRPVLVEHCYECHSKDAKKLKAGLRVDGRAHLLRGGDNGPAIVAKDPAKSRLIRAVKYDDVELQMPPKGKLPDQTIRDLETWIKQGAVWPGDDDKTDAKETPFDLAKRKAEHWAWQPVKPQTPPTVKQADWPRDPIDRFILSKLEAKQLSPAPASSKSVWLRRVTFALTGLPPTPEELLAFEKDDSAKAYENVADRLLASPAYGERWARHWLDLVRYAESRGHEHDPDIANAWQYRDYVVRAFNADVPYDRFVREHLAGDDPRYKRIVKETNEAIIGTGFWRLGEEGHSPVDIRQDQADRYDNRIDVFGKAFLGLTISCARCHDHKFDAISTKDYYAIFGLLQGSSDRQARIDDGIDHVQARLALDEQYSELAGELKEHIKSREPARKADYDRWRKQAVVVADYANVPRGDFRPDSPSLSLTPAGAIRFTGDSAVIEDRNAVTFDRFWTRLRTTPDAALEAGALGQKPRAGFTFRTPSFVAEKKGLFALVRGGGMAYAAVAGHTMISGPLHGGLAVKIVDGKVWRWLPIPLTLYPGQRLHLEFTADPETDFAVALVVQADVSPPSIPPPERIFEPLPEEVAKAAAKKRRAKERELAESMEWSSRLTPALWDGSPVDERVFIRGNHRTPGEIVPHRGLEALTGPQRIAHLSGSGRYEFAEQICDPKLNPFFTRVIVNRLWHHLFGRGIVASTDNFGVMGDRPTHPELLDYLATEFAAGGFKIKPFLKRLVLTQTYRMQSAAAEDPKDPANQLLHHFRIKRLEGEAIRDAMLAVSGRLDRTLGGPPVPMHLTAFMEGRGRPPKSGPLDGDGRRSLYLAVRRNFLSPFLLAFDTPIPLGTVGTRQVSNVPAQSLILMNDPFVHEQAKRWSESMASKPGTVKERIEVMYRQAFARSPNAEELQICREYLGVKEDWASLAHSLFQVKEFRYIP